MINRRYLPAVLVLFIATSGCFGGKAPFDPSHVFVLYTAVAAGRDHTCAIAGDKSMTCWGNNSVGQYGDGTWSSDPVGGVTQISDVASIACGSLRTCAIRTNGELSCWGFAPLGNGTNAWSNVPVVVPGLSAISVDTGRNHTCAVLTNRAVKCWGNGTSGQLGTGQAVSSASPLDVVGINDAERVTVGDGHGCVLRQNGAVACWGLGSFGQSGVSGNLSSQLSPVTLQGLEAVDLSAGNHHTCAVLRDGTVKCWGANWNGQLGRNSADLNPHPIPATVLGLATVKTLVAGGDHTCALLGDGGVKCWGRNDDGENGWGLAGMNPNALPIPVNNLSNPNALAAGWQHTCAVHSSSTLRCWGENEHGELADGTEIDRSAPEP